MKKWLFRFGSVVVATVLTLGILEIAVRLAWEKLQGPIIPLSLKTHRLSPDPLLGYELIPGSRSFEDQVWYRISRQGIRDRREFAIPKPAGVYRIAALGDSFTFGMGVEEEDTWPRRLESELAGWRSTEVINFGIMGYDTTQEARLLETRVLAFQPDLIVIGYCLNDIGVLSRERRVLSQYRGYNDFFTTGLSWLDRILGKSRLYMLVKNRLFLLKTKADTQPPHYSPDGQKVLRLGYQGFIISAYHGAENHDRLEAAFEKIRHLTEELQIPVIVAIYPELEHFDRYPYRDVHSEVRALAEARGFRVVDPLEQFLQFAPRQVRISDANAHPNRRGNELFAAAVARSVVALTDRK
jgi:lysophospholipase L1-like esterase